jgi:penicillin-binding protein 2
MLIFDQLRKDDPALRTVALAILGGLGLLVAGLWWIQIVSAREYLESSETQSFRTVRIPAVRGAILDRNGVILAVNRPTYSLCLYLDELRKPFSLACSNEIARAQAELKRQKQSRQKEVRRSLTKSEASQFALSGKQREALRQEARYQVASNVVAESSRLLQQPLWLNPTNFAQHYSNRLALPYPVMSSLNLTNIARFEEQSIALMGVDLEIQSMRYYPFGTTAAHLLGHLRRDDSAREDEYASFSYWLPDYCGSIGMEYRFDKELRGTAGGKSVLVNSMGYRQSESVWSSPEAGSSVVLTIDRAMQQAAERALNNAPLSGYSPVRGAVVVMDVHSGDVLALASSPTLDPNGYVQGLSFQEYARIREQTAEKNRATQENYMPGSVFKLVVGLAALEAGLDTNRIITAFSNPKEPNKAHKQVLTHDFRDTAAPGDYNFYRAIVCSCNSYFVTIGTNVGPEGIVRMAQKFHFGERIGLGLNQETAGELPGLRRMSFGWSPITTGNIAIGQDPVYVTPLQVAVMMSAIANGGTVLWPRLVDRIEPADPSRAEERVVYPSGQVRDHLGVSARTLSILQSAMLGDTEDPEGTGRYVHDARRPLPLHICAKTGTAQVQGPDGKKTGQTTWFASYAPAEKPRWAVVVMVENGAAGGQTCGPVAAEVYRALLEQERSAGRTVAAASTQ